MEYDAKHVANKLVELYAANFGGKPEGRFAIDRDQLKAALKVPRLHSHIVCDLTDYLADLGYTLIDLDSKFIVFETAKLNTYRKVPKKVFSDYFVVSAYEV